MRVEEEEELKERGRVKWFRVIEKTHEIALESGLVHAATTFSELESSDA
jgi:hypothetical protein